MRPNNFNNNTKLKNNLLLITFIDYDLVISIYKI